MMMVSQSSRSVSPHINLAIGAIAFALLCGARVSAEENPAAEQDKAKNAQAIAFFESKIRPVLVQHCYQCHSSTSGKSEGSLMLDTKSSVLTGGDRGPAIIPGDPDGSVLLTAMAHTDPDLIMPPKKDRLPDSVLADFKQWIAMGAPDPRDQKSPAGPRSSIDLEEGRKYWSFQPIVRQPIPTTRTAGWAKRELDHFVLAKLEANNLSPSADAEPATFLRRLYFDLIGLPPSPTNISDFVRRIQSEGIDRALEAEVDSLLASKHFGETWGRHWLDVARYAESSGKEANISFPYAWRYRDYVIDSINVDKPFNRFLTEQIAGDLLPYENDVQRAQLLIATGFLALGPKNLDEGNDRQFKADLIDEQIDTVTRAVIANSVACARCHDHKFDPFAMEDYYALAGIFASTKTFFGTMVSPANRVGGDPLELPKLEGQHIFHKGIPAAQVKKLEEELAKLKVEKPTTLTDALRIFWRTGAIDGQLDSVDDSGQPLPLAMGALDEKVVDAPLFERGDVARPTKKIPRGFPRVVELKDGPQVPSKHSGRLEFAQWLTHPDHPLPARVISNRIWHYLIGAGLVRTVDNFGITGERPSHPELLDYLAIRFVDEGWSIKSLVREIALSRTYRQSSAFDETKFKVDPDNRLLWHIEKRRLDAEAIRDAMLLVAGELDTARPPGSLVARQIGDRPISLIGLDEKIPQDLDDGLHRSVYLPILRDRLPDILDLFDFAEPSLVTGDRDTTNVPVQALYLMNSPFVQARAEAFANRLEKMSDNDEQRIRDAFSLCYCRAPEPDELAVANEFLRQGYQRAGEDKALRRQVLVSYCQALLSTAEFRNLD
jgi:hypothetical protein